MTKSCDGTRRGFNLNRLCPCRQEPGVSEFTGKQMEGQTEVRRMWRSTERNLEKITKSNRTSREAEYAGCILVDYKLRSKYKTGGLIYRRRTGMYGDGAE